MYHNLKKIILPGRKMDITISYNEFTNTLPYLTSFDRVKSKVPLLFYPTDADNLGFFKGKKGTGKMEMALQTQAYDRDVERSIKKIEDDLLYKEWEGLSTTDDYRVLVDLKVLKPIILFCGEEKKCLTALTEFPPNKIKTVLSMDKNGDLFRNIASNGCHSIAFMIYVSSSFIKPYAIPSKYGNRFLVKLMEKFYGLDPIPGHIIDDVILEPETEPAFDDRYTENLSKIMVKTRNKIDEEAKERLIKEQEEKKDKEEIERLRKEKQEALEGTVEQQLALPEGKPKPLVDSSQALFEDLVKRLKGGERLSLSELVHYQKIPDVNFGYVDMDIPVEDIYEVTFSNGSLFFHTKKKEGEIDDSFLDNFPEPHYLVYSKELTSDEEDALQL